MEEYVEPFVCTAGCSPSFISVARSRAQVHQPRIVPMPDDDEDREIDSDDSDRKSKMSFSYWGADKITVQKPVIKGRTPAPRRGGVGSSYGRESSANAKFGTRLVSGDTSPTPRPASRRTAGTPTSRRPTDDSNVNYAKSTTTPVRPEWNNNTRSPVPGATAAKPRTRNTSQTSAAVSSTRLANAKGLASPAPSADSVDSGVGLYRQMLAQDPSLNDRA